jgi:hypothetical protein
MSDRSTDPPGDRRHDGDAALYELLRDVEFADHAFELLAVHLTAYGWGVLCGWLRSGVIFGKCAEQGRPVIPTDGERAVLYNEPDELHGLVNETLAEALVFLRERAVTGEGKWDPAGDSLLTTYFVGACVLRFPTVYRRWSRLQQRTPPPATVDSMDKERPSADSVEDTVVAQITAEEGLHRMPVKERRIVALRMDGQSYAEIAVIVGAPSARAVEAVVTRYRKRLRERGEGDPR